MSCGKGDSLNKLRDSEPIVSQREQSELPQGCDLIKAKELLASAINETENGAEPFSLNTFSVDAGISRSEEINGASEMRENFAKPHNPAPSATVAANKLAADASKVFSNKETMSAGTGKTDIPEKLIRTEKEGGSSGTSARDRRSALRVTKWLAPYQVKKLPVTDQLALIIGATYQNKAAAFSSFIIRASSARSGQVAGGRDMSAGSN